MDYINLNDNGNKNSQASKTLQILQIIRYFYDPNVSPTLWNILSLEIWMIFESDFLKIK